MSQDALPECKWSFFGHLWFPQRKIQDPNESVNSLWNGPSCLLPTNELSIDTEGESFCAVGTNQVCSVEWEAFHCLLDSETFLHLSPSLSGCFSEAASLSWGIWFWRNSLPHKTLSHTASFFLWYFPGVHVTFVINHALVCTLTQLQKVRADLAQRLPWTLNRFSVSVKPKEGCAPYLQAH